MSDTVSAPPIVPQKASGGTKFFYGFGSVAYGVAGIALASSLLTPYMNRVMHLPALWVGTVLMLTLMLDAVIDPMIGQFSDNLRTRWGRRHPLLYVSGPLIAVAVVLFWNSPVGQSETMKWVYLIGTLILMRVTVSLYEVPSSALAPELAPDYHDRTSVLSYRYFFGVIGGLIMTVILYRVYLTPANGGMLNPAGYGSYAILAAAVIFGSILISALGTHGQIRNFAKPAVRPITWAGTLREMSVTLTNRSLLVVMLSGLLSGVATGMSNALSQYFQLELWHLDNNQIGSLAFAGLPATFAAVLMATPLSRAFGKKKAMIGLFAVYLATGVLPLSLNMMGVLKGDGSPLVFWVLFIDAVVAGALAIAGLIIVSSMIADVVEDTAVKTGQRSEGLLLAANGLLPKFTSGIGVFLGGVLLEVVAFPRDAGQGQVPAEIMQRLALMYLPASAILTGMAIAVLGWYRIDKETHERNLATLAEAAALADRATGEEPSPSTARPGSF